MIEIVEYHDPAVTSPRLTSISKATFTPMPYTTYSINARPANSLKTGIAPTGWRRLRVGIRTCQVALSPITRMPSNGWTFILALSEENAEYSARGLYRNDDTCGPVPITARPAASVSSPLSEAAVIINCCLAGSGDQTVQPPPWPESCPLPDLLHPGQPGPPPAHHGCVAVL